MPSIAIEKGTPAFQSNNGYERSQVFVQGAIKSYFSRHIIEMIPVFTE
jgi:hypothetical protein